MVLRGGDSSAGGWTAVMVLLGTISLLIFRKNNVNIPQNRAGRVFVLRDVMVTSSQLDRPRKDSASVKPFSS